MVSNTCKMLLFAAGPLLLAEVCEAAANISKSGGGTLLNDISKPLAPDGESAAGEAAEDLMKQQVDIPEPGDAASEAAEADLAEEQSAAEVSVPRLLDAMDEPPMEDLAEGNGDVEPEVLEEADAPSQTFSPASEELAVGDGGDGAESTNNTEEAISEASASPNSAAVSEASPVGDGESGAKVSGTETGDSANRANTQDASSSSSAAAGGSTVGDGESVAKISGIGTGDSASRATTEDLAGSVRSGKATVKVDSTGVSMTDAQLSKIHKLPPDALKKLPKSFFQDKTQGDMEEMVAGMSDDQLDAFLKNFGEVYISTVQSAMKSMVNTGLQNSINDSLTSVEKMVAEHASKAKTIAAHSRKAA